MKHVLTPDTRVVVTQPFEAYRHVCRLADLLADNDVEEMLPVLAALRRGDGAMVGGGAAPLFMVERL